MTRQKWFYAAVAAVVAGIAFEARATVYNSPPDPVPTTLVPGDVVNLGIGATYGNGLTASPSIGNVTFNINGGAASALFHTLSGSTVNLYQGTIGPLGTANGGVWNIYGGTIGNSASFSAGATLNLHGGEIELDSGFAGSTVNMTGGLLAVTATSLGSTLTMSGGEIETYYAFDSTLNLLGGMISGDLVYQGGAFHLSVQSASLGGQPILGLVNGVPYTVTQRGTTLSGVLLDGTAFSFPLGMGGGGPSGYVSSSTLLTVTKIPEPSSVATAIPAVLYAIGAWRRRRHVLA
jgi:hypothetical protein